MYRCVYGEFVQLLDVYLGNGTGHRTATMAASLELTSSSNKWCSEV